MTKIQLLKPLLIHVVISIIAGIGLNIISSFDRQMIGDLTRNIIYIIVTVVVIFLYLLLSRKLLKKLSRKTLLNSVTIILTINLVLGLTGSLMMNFGSGIMAENGQLPSIMLILFNAGFGPLFSLSSLPQFLNIILLSLAAPILLYLGSRKSVTIEA